MFMLSRFLVFLVCLPLAAFASDFKALQALKDRGAQVSAMAILLSDKQPILAQLDAGEPLAPASISKLYVAAYVLDTFSPYFRFSTRLVSEEEVDDKGVLGGDLIFYGVGDPTLDTSGIWQMVVDLKSKAGVKQIKGDIVINQSRFGQIDCDGVDRCAARKISRNAYDAPLSSAGVNYASWCITIEPGEKVGDPAVVADCQLQINGVTLDNAVKTVASGRPRQVNVIRKTEGGNETIRLKGQIPLGHSPYKVYRSTANAPLQTARVLQRSLQELGIRVKGRIKVSNLPLPTETIVLAQNDSQQLNHQLNSMLLWSSNYMADLLMLSASSRRLKTRPTLETASEDLSSFAKEVNSQLPKHLKSLTGTPSLLNGSGLNPENRFSAGDMIGLLHYMYRRHDLFPAFVGGMTMPAFSYSSRLRSAPDNWRENLMVKTGTLSYPVTVSTLAGYFRCPNGDWGAFTVMVNGTPTQPSVAYRDINNALYEDLSAIIESCK